MYYRKSIEISLISTRICIIVYYYQEHCLTAYLLLLASCYINEPHIAYVTSRCIDQIVILYIYYCYHNDRCEAILHPGILVMPWKSLPI